MEIQGPLEAWIVDDTVFPKKGTHSVGVAHQYCGLYGKTSNCQNAVSVSLASRWASVPVAFRLYLPERWAKDQERRIQAGVPQEVRFQTKWQIALALIDAQREDGEPDLPVLADAGYGDACDFREGLAKCHLPYVVGISKTTTFAGGWKRYHCPRANQRERGSPGKRLGGIGTTINPEAGRALPRRACSADSSWQRRRPGLKEPGIIDGARNSQS